MKKSFSTLAHNYDINLIKPNATYAVSRKYNGMGVIWDGGYSRGRPADQFSWYRRGGDKTPPICTGLWSIDREETTKVVNCPAWFSDKLPKYIPLQGELWCNDNLQYLQTHCKVRNPNPILWYPIKFIAYNIKPYSIWGLDKKTLPTPYLFYWENLPWKFLCLEHLGSEFKQLNDLIEIPEFTWLHSAEKETFIIQLEKLFNKAMRNNWEGLMLQNVDSLYECHRSYNLLKMKPTYDGEAIITGYEEGKTGKNIGRCGSICAVLTWDESITSIHGGREEFIGKKVKLKISGLEDEEREWENIEEDFPIGSEVSFTFKGVTEYGVPVSCNVKR